ncbi:MAG: TonB-dependent receptor, partial [Saprospiraceae bacterium]|nr:TonB-dependent receptor [Saprospiraceae bacterium]
AQQSYTISGYIADLNSGERLISASVYELHSERGTTTNAYGFYSISLSEDSVSLQFSYTGYQSKVVRFLLDRDTTLAVDLDGTTSLSTVEVTAEKSERLEEKSQMGRMEIPVEQIKKAPALLGEVDVLKTIQLLPGVQSGGEGQNGFYVRGCSPDQNLILLDGVPVYNASHVGGIFSVFNADAIKSVSLSKGGFPARYGGRISSILEINLKDGHKEKFHGEGAIGLISSKLTLEAPVIKGRSSFLISGRRTYLDLLTRPIVKAEGKRSGVDIKPKLHFYDLNFKYNHSINSRHRLFISLYSGRDVFFTRLEEEDAIQEGGLDWGNIITSLRWNWQVSQKVFSNLTAIFSDYDFAATAGVFEINPNQPESNYRTKYLSGIQDFGLKWDFDYIPNPNHYIKFGAGSTRHIYDPGALTVKFQDQNIDLDTLIGSQKAKSIESYLYLEDDFVWRRFKTNLGLHFSGFLTEGKWYSSLQPRISTRYLLNNDWSIKGAFNTMYQYINLLTSEALSLPTDLWVPSTKSVLPQRSWQLSLGAAKTINDQYEFSVETYYKEMKNVISYKPGADFLFGFENDWQDKITQGIGKAYGVEFFFQKKTGKTTGWLGYTLSWNKRQFDLINNGKVFPFRYDRRHDLSLVVNHDFSKRINASVSWVYGTGNAITIPVSRYQIYQDRSYQYRNSYQGFIGLQETYGDKNAFRMTSYHRLDFNISFH